MGTQITAYEVVKTPMFTMRDSLKALVGASNRHGLKSRWPLEKQPDRFRGVGVSTWENYSPKLEKLWRLLWS